jgi:hypothetical protein
VTNIASSPAQPTETRVIERRGVIERQVSLSRGLALILGVVLLAAGLYFLYKQHRFPPLGNFPNGRARVDGHVFLGIFAANGWTGMGTAIGGGLLLFGAAEHNLAKAISLLVGLVFALAAIVAAISCDVLGLAAAGLWTEVGWGVCAAILLLNVRLPAWGRNVAVAATAASATTADGGSAVTTGSR